MLLFSPLVVALVISLITVPVLIRLARRVGLVDLPDARKQHAGAIPLVGGVAIFFATSIALTLAGIWREVPAGFVVAAAVILLLGLLDDARDLGAVVRFGVQAAAVWFAVWSAGHLLPDLGRLTGQQVIALNTWSTMLTVVGILGVVNALNLLDGADGLAGGVAATALFWLILVFSFAMNDGTHPAGAYALPVLASVFGGVLGFLYFNLRRRARRRASVFLGDAGSLLLGFVLGWFVVGATIKPGTGDLPPAAALWLLWVPLYDTVGVMLRRLLAGRSPMRPDREHLHHLFQDLGFTPRQTVNRLIALNFMGGAVGVAGWRLGVPEVVLFALFAFGFLCYVLLCMWVWRKLKAPPPSLRRARRHAARAQREAAREGAETHRLSAE
jgi:UDP-GlcNAc:undecaprenyl-phosphate GlcNAc-1-phosphate transferase